MALRSAEVDDVERMAELSDLKRTEYECFAPTFWRKAEGAVEGQKTFFRALLGRPNVIVLVWEEGEVEGFIIGSVIPPPPVYDPGKNVCVVDDFVVSNPELWLTVGVALLNAVRERAEGLEAHPKGALSIGDGNRFYPQTFFCAEQGQLFVGHDNTFGEGGVTCKTVVAGETLVIEDGGRYQHGACLLGTNHLGAGSQVLGALTVQHCTLGAGESFAHPDPDARGGVLKRAGTARGLRIGRGEVISSRKLLEQADLERQTAHHPQG